MIQTQKNQQDQKPLKRNHIFILWFMIIALFSAFEHMSFLPSLVRSFIQLGLLLYTPFLLPAKWRLKEMNRDDWKVSKSEILNLTKWTLGTSFVVLGASAFLWHFGMKIFGYTFFHQSQPYLQIFATQLIMTALPEEAFFRGYLQPKLKEFESTLTPKWHVLGVTWTPAILVTTLLFAISHSIIHPQIWHLLIVFPAFIFAGLREKTQSLWPSVFFHASCNVFSVWALSSYRF